MFIQLIKNGITDLVLLSSLLAMVVMAYAGYLWLSSGGNTSNHKAALNALWNVVLGYIWIVAAWVIIYTITSALLDPSFNKLLEK